VNQRREIWSQVHGTIPKDYLVYTLNGQPSDLRPENLAAIPRYPKHTGELIAPYIMRIKNLEKELKLLKEKNNGNRTR